MGVNEDFYCRQFFQLQVHKASGDAFQHLFDQVMGYTHAGFQSITPWGNWGDGGNDGWTPEEGHYFQIYGPKPTTSTADSETTALPPATAATPVHGILVPRRSCLQVCLVGGAGRRNSPGRRYSRWCSAIRHCPRFATASPTVQATKPS